MSRSQKTRHRPPVHRGTDVQARVEQIIDKVDKLQSGKGGLAAAIAYLEKDMDESLFSAILHTLDIAPPSGPLEGPPTGGDIASSEAALRTLTQLATIMATIDALAFTVPPTPASSSPRTSTFVDMCLKAVLDRWGTIIRWIDLFILPDLGPINPSWQKITSACIQVIQTAVRNADDDLYRGEIVALPSTTGCIVRLLCLRDPSTGRPSSLRDGRTVCLIIRLAFTSVLSGAGRESMTLKLASLKPSAVEETIKCILERIEDIVPDSNSFNATMIGVAATEVAEILFILPTLPRKPVGRLELSPWRTILSGATRATAQIVNYATQIKTQDPETWGSIALCFDSLTANTDGPSKEEGHEIESVLENGLIPTVLRSLPHVHPSYSRRVQEVARKVLFWLLDSKMFFAAKKGGLSKELLQQLGRVVTTRSPRVEPIQGAYAMALVLLELTFEGKNAVPVRLCGNMKHSEPIQSVENVQSLKICGRCDSAVYCSNVCQKADWLAIHSRECLQTWDQRRKLSAVGYTDRYRRDKVMFLAQVANRFLGDQPPRFMYPKGSKDTEPPVHAFDFTGVILQITNNFVGNMSDTLSGIFGRYPIAPSTQTRMRQCAEEMKDRLNLVLVVGSFIDRRIGTIVCIQMQYFPYSAAGQRYKVIKTVVDAFFRSSVSEAPPLTEADARLLADMGVEL